jgi:CRP-like cAMP-binding protein
MERRIISALQTGASISQDDRGLLESFIRDHFLREYYSPLPFAALYPHLVLRHFAAGEAVFLQGEPLEEYCFLLLGRVMATRRQRQEEDERCLLDGPTLLGETPEGRQPRRERTARVVSPEATVLAVPREVLHSLLVHQMAEFDHILRELATFAGSTAEGLDRVRLAPLVRLEKYRMKEVVRARERVGYLVVEGECRVRCHRREVVVSRGNCLAITDYFEHSDEDCNYSAYSTELHLVAFAYEAVPLLPPAFAENLSFLHQAHRQAMQEAPFPRLERNTTNPSLHERPPYLAHKAKKSSSLAELDDGTAAEVQSFRKQFVLGFYSEQAAASAQDYGRRRPREPRGYFELRVRA